MAISFLGSNTGTVAPGAGNGSFSLGGGLSEDDVVILFTVSDGNYFSSRPVTEDGWTIIADGTTGTPSPDAVCYYKVMGSTPDTTVTVDRSSSVDVCCIAAAFSGVDTTTPIDAQATPATGSTGMPNAPSLTTVTDGAMRVALGGVDDDEATGVTLSGWSTVLQIASSATAMGAFLSAPTAGTVDPPAFVAGGGGSDDEWWAIQFALRESGATPGGNGGVLAHNHIRMLGR